MGLAIFCKIFLTFGLNGGIFFILLSIPHNIVMDLDNVMSGCMRTIIISYKFIIRVSHSLPYNIIWNNVIMSNGTVNRYGTSGVLCSQSM